MRIGINLMEKVKWIVRELEKIFRKHPEIKKKLERDREYAPLVKLAEALMYA